MRPRVLLADDHALLVGAFEKLLAGECDIVGQVNDGRALVVAAAKLQPDVIVLDISMPGMTGLEVASRLCQAGSKAAVVFLTAHREEDFRDAALSAGGIGYVLKPRLASDLITAVLEARAGRHFISPAS